MFTKWIKDASGNKCSTKYFGSKFEAQKALESLVNCEGCINCVDCEGCRECEACDNCANCDHCKECKCCNNCRECFSCLSCRECFGCRECVKCSDCSYSQQCHNLAQRGYADDTIAVRYKGFSDLLLKNLESLTTNAAADMVREAVCPTQQQGWMGSWFRAWRSRK